MEWHVEQAQAFARLLMQGKVAEALRMEMRCQECSKQFAAGQGAVQQGKKAIVNCPYCNNQVLELEAK